jgi:hypothetical protein
MVGDDAMSGRIVFAFYNTYMRPDGSWDEGKEPLTLTCPGVYRRYTKRVRPCGTCGPIYCWSGRIIFVQKYPPMISDEHTFPHEGSTVKLSNEGEGSGEIDFLYNRPIPFVFGSMRKLWLQLRRLRDA